MEIKTKATTISSMLQICYDTGSELREGLVAYFRDIITEGIIKTTSVLSSEFDAIP